MSEHKKIPVILDGDPGHDDAIAWVLARASRELGILAVTSCCGNQTIEKTTYNALRVCTLIGLHAPVGKGCPHPLLNDVMNAPSVHGESGLDGPALPELSVVALSAVAGNSPLYNTFPNTRRIVHLLGADYPVYPGAERPLVREPHVAGKFHGENGLGDVELPLPDCAPETTPAWDALYEAAKRMPGELRLVATGPLTNVAIALTKYPELKTLLHSIALMGGAAVGGNVTPAAEFNIYDDPDAAQIVFKSGVPLVMCGLDVTMQAELRPADWDEMAGYGNRCGSLVRELFACAWSAVQTVGLTGVAQHDSCPVLYLAHPELFEGKMAGVFVETQAELTLGKTVTDLQSDKKFEQKNALVLLKLDREAFMQLLKDCIRTLP